MQNTNVVGRAFDMLVSAAWIGVEIHSVDRFQFERHMTLEISATLLCTIVSELPESAAQVATDPKRVYYVGAGFNSCLLPGLHFF